MAWELPRRQLLGAGATLSLGLVAGCNQPFADQDTLVTDGAGVLPASYVVTKQAGEIQAYNGSSLKVEFSGTAGEEDGRVLQEVFDATSGGRVFIRRGDYSPDRRLSVNSSFTEVYSDFARLTFQDHPNDDGETQIDFAVDGTDSPTEHVEINGLVLDGNKSNRTGGTRTADIWGETRHLAFRNCLIYGGKGDEGGEGYGIGEDNNADYITIDNCVIRDSDRHAYHPSAAHNSILNSTFINNAQNGSDVFDLAATNAIVANNHIENNGNGVRLDSTDVDSPNGRILITGNVFVNNAMDGQETGQLHLADASARSAVVTGNTFLLPGGQNGELSAHLLIFQESSMGSLLVQNNHFEGGGRAAVMASTDGGQQIETLAIERNTFDGLPADIGTLAGAKRLLIRDNLFDCLGSEAGRLEIRSIDSGVVAGNVNYNATIDIADEANIIEDRNYEF